MKYDFARIEKKWQDNWEITFTDEKLKSVLRTAGYNVGNIRKVQVTK